MAHVIIHPSMSMDEKVRRMQEDARYDITEAEASAATGLAQIRSAVRGPKAYRKVPKVFLGNDCVFNCAYCGCRAGNECKRCYQLTPRELAEVAVRQARKERRGIFLTSAILSAPDHTEELIIRTMKIIRHEMGYGGYLHAKVMPGTDPGLIYEAGLYADRLSVNIEVARSEGYPLIARNKSKRNILAPMGQISQMIRAARAETSLRKPRFATTQSTQIMAGSTGEDDYTILNLSSALYRKYDLSRIYYTAFEYAEEAAGYENLAPVHTPPWRMNRLYQADRLINQYGFEPEELAPQGARYLSRDFDPKAAWALRNLERFPVEVNTAEQEILLRVPGIGITYAKRIIAARQTCKVTHEVLKQIGVPLKRARHFITCAGVYKGETCEDGMMLSAYLAEPIWSASDISPLHAASPADHGNTPQQPLENQWCV